ncbi:PREDICTED: putative protein arginine N-methyltransferase 9 [Nicrophorus vespilloides]|uniref:Protein arginine N-methyltransferase domain-containing protein n=1 Tax=Nicrophorus vespilloides TaxID=110193 RepID=A0ABM1N2W7_NICVS|nr:PREDICTED: putative protein arginine N-methyltransferase 9 [Nicrophorus vespilloides]
MDENKVKVAQDSLQKVHEYRFSGNNGRAFAHFLLFLELLPAERQKHEQHFSDTATEWCTELELKGQFENVCKCYSQAINYFPKNVEILNSFGSFLLRCNAPLESKVYLNAAHRIDAENLVVLSNLNTANLQLVERWHFRMLNDVRRNSLYNEAIQKSIDGRYNKVLDIGTGCGFLSLCASKNANTSRIIAVEESEALSAMAEEVFQRNNVENIKVLNGNSTQINDISLSNVLITEIFDSALFGEHCLETLIHAHEKLLEKDCRIIPASAKIYITGIESKNLAKKHKVISSHEHFGELCIVECKDEPYEAEHVSKYDHKLLTETVQLLNVDFSNLEQLKSLYNDPKSIPDTELKIVESGTLHAFAIWFTLELSDGLSITTNPYSDNCDCWEQAIVFLDHFQTKCKGESLVISASCAQNKLQITYTNGDESSCDCYQVQKDVVNFLNDSKLIQTLNDASRSIQKTDELHVLDLYPFPIIGLNLMAQSNATVVTITENADLLRKMCDLNGVDFGRFKMISESDLSNECSQKYDVVAFDPISRNGTICESFFANYTQYSNALKDDGVFVPNALRLKFALVESCYLVNCNAVSDANVMGFKIADCINQFKASELWIMQHGNFPHKKLTAICDDYKVQFEDAFNVRECRIESVKGRADGILYWFDIHYPGNVSMDTYNSNYYNKVVSVVKETVNMETPKVQIKQHKGLLSILLK